MSVTRRPPRLPQLTRLVAACLDPAEVLSTVTSGAATIMRARFVSFWTADAATRTLTGVAASDEALWKDYPLRTVSFDSGLVGEVARKCHAISIADVLQDPRTEVREWARRHGLGSYYGVPLTLGDSVLGVLSIHGSTPFGFRAAQRVLADFAEQAAIALDNSRRFGASERRRQAAESLAEVGRLLTQSLDVRVVARRILDSVGALVRGHSPSLYRLDPATGALVAIAVSGQIASTIEEGFAFPPGTGMGGLAVRCRETVTSPNFLADPRVLLTPELRQRLEQAPYRALLSVPLLVKDNVIGVLSVGDREGRVFDEVDVHIAQAFADQAAVAISNAELFTASERRRRTAEALAEVGRTLAGSLDTDVVAHRILEAMAGLLAVRMGILYRRDPTSGDLRSIAVIGPLATEGGFVLPRGTGLAGRAVEERRPLVTADLMEDPRIAPPSNMRPRIQNASFRALLSIPLMVKGEVIGALTVGDAVGRVFAEEDVSLAQAFANQAALSLHNAEILRESREHQARLEMLLDVSRQLSSVQPITSLLQAIASSAMTLLGDCAAGLWVIDRDEARLSIAADAGYRFPDRRSYRTLAVGEGVVGQAVQTQKLLVTDNAQVDPRWVNRALAEAEGFQASVAVPLLFGGRCYGALCVSRRSRGGFRAEEAALLTSLASQAASALENASLYEGLREKNQHLQELFDVARQASISLTLSDLIPTLVKAAAGLVGHDAASIRLLNESGTELLAVAHHGLSETFANRGPIPVSEAIVGRNLLAGQPRFIEELEGNTDYRLREQALAEGIRALALVPLRSRDHTIGVLATYARSARPYHQADKDLLAEFANVAAITIENARQYEQAQIRAARMKRLIELGQLVGSTLDAQSVLEFVTRAATELLHGDLVRIWAVDEASQTLELVAASGDDPACEMRVPDRIPLDESLVGWVVKHREKHYSPDLHQDPRFFDKAWARAAGVFSAISVPLVTGETAIGVLSILTRTPRRFTDDEVELLELFASKAAVALVNAQLYEASARALAEVKAKNAELDSFAYMVSHDLKSPLVTIQGMASMLDLDCGPALDERGRHYLTRIEANIGQMERLISDLLALSRVGRDGRQPEQVCLTELVDEVLAGLAENISARRVQVDRGELPSVRGIRTQLAQIFSNLIGNAVKYLGDTDEPRVSIGASDHGAWIECYVRDNGIGIDPDYHDKVFELFQRLKDVPVEGSGVGLPIVKKIVEAAGGRIWVESAKGHGATFFFTWPKSARAR